MSWFDYSAFENGMPFDEQYIKVRNQDKNRNIKINKDVVFETIKTDEMLLEFSWQITKYNNLMLVSTNFKNRKTKKKGS